MQYSKRDISDMEHAHVVSELPEKIINKETFENLQAVEIPEHLRDMIELTDIEHREFNNKMYSFRIRILQPKWIISMNCSRISLILNSLKM